MPAALTAYGDMFRRITLEQLAAYIATSERLLATKGPGALLGASRTLEVKRTELAKAILKARRPPGV